MERPLGASQLLIAGAIFLLAGLCGCNTFDQTAPGVGASAIMPASYSFLGPVPPNLPQEEGSEVEEEASVWGTVLLYIPNRIIDALDMARAGVNVGPGIGFDARVTKFARLQLISDTSVGVGYQTLRHLPVCVRSQAKLGIAFLSTPSWDILNWYYGDYDVRLELYLLLVGAHVAVDLGEVVDFVGGIFTWDPMQDDFRVDL
jgi:hypothetical protein